MASDGDDPDASSPSTIRDLLVELPDGEYMYKHAEAPTRDLEYEELARVVEAARSLNFYERVRPWDDLRRILDLMAALAPCVLGYGEIGTRLAAAAGDTAYADWIATYAGDDYQDTCRAVAGLIDGAVAYRLGPSPTDSPRWPRLCARFETATRLEVDFWGMGLSG